MESRVCRVDTALRAMNHKLACKSDLASRPASQTSQAAAAPQGRSYRRTNQTSNLRYGSMGHAPCEDTVPGRRRREALSPNTLPHFRYQRLGYQPLPPNTLRHPFYPHPNLRYASRLDWPKWRNR